MVLVTVIPTLRLNGASPMMVGMSLGSCPISPLREYFVWTVTLFSKWYRRLGIISDDFIFDLSHQFSRPKYQDKAVSQYLSALPNGTYAGLFNPYVFIWQYSLNVKFDSLLQERKSASVIRVISRNTYQHLLLIGIPWCLSTIPQIPYLAGWKAYSGQRNFCLRSRFHCPLEWCSSISRSSPSRIFESLNLLCPGIIRWHHRGPQFWM